MSHDLLLALDDFREFIGTPIIVTSGNQGVHSPNSYHYIENGSCAVDVVIPKYTGSVIDLLFDAKRFLFTGVGYYTWWTFYGEKAHGLHLDMRPTPMAAHWLSPAKGKYIDLSFANLVAHADLEYLPNQNKPN